MWADQPIQDWIDAVCRHYSRIMGRALTFHPDAGGSTAPRLPSEADEHWRATISDGAQTVGILRLKSRSGHERDAEFLRACETAELTAQLIERAIHTRGHDEFRSLDVPAGLIKSLDAARPTPEAASDGTAASRAASRITRLLDALRRMTGYPAAALYLRGDDGGEKLSALRSTESIRLSRESIADCPAGFDDNAGSDGVSVFRKSVDPQTPLPFLPASVSTALACRIRSTSGPAGSLWVFDRRDRPATHRDRHMLRLVADRLAPVMEQAALLDERSKGRLLHAELKVVSRTHLSAPVHYRAPDGWCEIAGCTQSARGIGGDLFELLPLADGCVFLAVGDAAGHSIPAAMVMANVRGALRALFDAHPDPIRGRCGPPPHQILQRVNGVLHSIVQSHQFMTMFCALLDGRTMTLEYANAGHPQPLLLRGGEVLRLSRHGLVLGVTSDAAYDSETISLTAGDVLVMYTDGITEAACRDHNLFGSARIEDIVRGRAAHSARALRDEIWSALQEHLSGSNQHDDRTIAVLRVAGAAALPHASRETSVCQPA